MRGTGVLLVISLLLHPTLAQAQTAADSPVRLADAQSFEAPLFSEVTRGEIAGARREMANAVAAEKFIDGAKAILIVALAVYSASSGGGRCRGAFLYRRFVKQRGIRAERQRFLR